MSWILGPAGLFWPLAMWIAGLSAALVFGLSLSWLLPSLCTREAQCLLVSQSFVWVFGALCTLFGASMSFLLGNQCLAQMRSFGWAGGITWVLSLGGCEKGFGPFGGFPASWSNARARARALCPSGFGPRWTFLALGHVDCRPLCCLGLWTFLLLAPAVSVHQGSTVSSFGESRFSLGIVCSLHPFHCLHVLPAAW